MSFDGESFDTIRSMTTLVKTSCTAKGVMIPPPLSYSMVKRMIVVDEDESVEVNEDSNDPLAEEIVAAAETLSFTEREGRNANRPEIGTR